MRRLIINADDLGLTQGVNRAIFEANQNGVVTSATLMAGSAALDDALSQLRSRASAQKLSIGCHVTLVDGRPQSPSEQVSSLLKGPTEFRRTIGQLGMAARRGQLSANEIESEVTAQFQSLQARGVKLSHFDAHKHSHMFPQILEPTLRAAKACGIGAVRNPFERAQALPFSTLAGYPPLWKRYLQVQALRSMRSKWTRLVRQHGFATPDGSIGIVVTGDLDEALLKVMLERLPEGTWELVCHPGYDDADLAKMRTRLRKSRAQELALLTSESTCRLIERLGIELISYNEL